MKIKLQQGGEKWYLIVNLAVRHIPNREDA